MNVNFKSLNRTISKYQQGGEIPPTEDPNAGAPVEGGAPAENGGGEDPMVQLVQVFQQGLQNQDCNLLAQGAQMFLQLIQGQAGGAPADQGAPVFGKGGILLRRVRN